MIWKIKGSEIHEYEPRTKSKSPVWVLQGDHNERKFICTTKNFETNFIF